MLGKELHTYETTKFGKIKNLIGTFFPILIFGGLAILVSHYIMSSIFVVIGVVLSIRLYEYSYKAVIHEYGIFIKKGKKEYEVQFNEIYYIIDAVMKSNFICKTRIVGICTADYGMISINQGRLGKFNDFANQLNSLYTKYFLKDITPENICSKNLNFGNYLRLENGNFILKGTIGKSGIIPAERIIAHSPGLAGLIALKGYDSNGKMKDLMLIHPKQTGNMEALYYIIDKIIPNIPKI